MTDGRTDDLAYHSPNHSHRDSDLTGPCRCPSRRRARSRRVPARGGSAVAERDRAVPAPRAPLRARPGRRRRTVRLVARVPARARRALPHRAAACWGRCGRARPPRAPPRRRALRLRDARALAAVRDLLCAPRVAPRRALAPARLCLRARRAPAALVPRPRHLRRDRPRPPRCPAHVSSSSTSAATAATATFTNIALFLVDAIVFASSNTKFDNNWSNNWRTADVSCSLQRDVLGVQLLDALVHDEPRGQERACRTPPRTRACRRALRRCGRRGPGRRARSRDRRDERVWSDCRVCTDCRSTPARVCPAALRGGRRRCCHRRAAHALCDTRCRGCARPRRRGHARRRRLLLHPRPAPARTPHRRLRLPRRAPRVQVLCLHPCPASAHSHRQPLHLLLSRRLSRLSTLVLV